MLNNLYIPKSILDKEKFDKELNKNNITKEELLAFVRKDKYKRHRKDKAFLDICERIEKSFDRVITKDSDILQGCVWKIDLNEVEKIEIIKDDGYAYGSINYVRANGERKDWINEFYGMLNKEKI